MRRANKSVLILIILALGLQFIVITFVSAKDVNPILNKNKVVQDSNEQVYKDAFVTLLQPYTDKAIADYYAKYLNTPPQENPWYVKVLSIERSNPKSFEFVVKIEVAPYIGPHDAVGIDHITFNVNSIDDVKLDKFEHIKSFEIAPNLQNIIKSWPPK